MTALIARALPFFNKFIPAGIAVKGLSKIDPRLSAFAQNSLAAGYTAENVIDYLRDRMSPEGDKMESQRLETGASRGNLTSQEEAALGKRRQEGGLGKMIGAGVGLATGLGSLAGSQEQPTPPPFRGNPTPPEVPLGERQAFNEERATELEQGYNENQQQVQGQSGQQIQNPIEQMAPALHQFILKSLSQGQNPQAALALAKIQGFDKMISQISKSIGIDLFNAIDQIYGQSKTALQPSAQTQSPQGQQQLTPILTSALQNVANLRQKKAGKL